MSSDRYATRTGVVLDQLKKKAEDLLPKEERKGIKEKVQGKVQDSKAEISWKIFKRHIKTIVKDIEADKFAKFVKELIYFLEWIIEE